MDTQLPVKPEESQLAGLCPPAELPSAALYRSCNPDLLGFTTTEELPDLQNVIGQPRAIRALELGSEVSGPGYNVFVLGLPGSGRATLSQEYLRRRAEAEPVPDDWCYVNNFDDPHKPHSLRLPAGRGDALRKDLKELVSYSGREIPRIFESKEYVQARDRIVDELKKNQEGEFIRLQGYVERYQFVLARTPFGFVLTPGVHGKPLKPEEVESLSPEQRAKIEQLALKLGEEVEQTLNRIREMARHASEQLNELNARTGLFVTGPLIEALKIKYAGLEAVLAHLVAVQADIVSNASRFQPGEGGEQSAMPGNQGWMQRYEVNVLVDNGGQSGAPVIAESHPVYYNLLGRIEHEVIMGASRTDFTMIQPGALHRANGGYLILPARDLLINPYAWEGLKWVLRDGAIRIVELGSQLGLLSTETLEPEPIPLDLKVILVGTPLLYYLLRIYDEDFAKLFKVRAEFATIMERTPETEREYGLFVKSVLDDNHLPPFDCTAVARLVEYSARLAEDQDKLSTRFGKIADLIREAAYWAKKEDAAWLSSGIDSGKPVSTGVVTSTAVQRAIEESIYRNNLVEERVQELITQDILRIDTRGVTVGQINALSVIFLGDYAFGRPSRVTASVSPGMGGVLDIERQSKLGGPIHTKGVLIIHGFLCGRYGRRQPLSLSASLTFEQSYDEVEGDSASAAELLALLSAIADIPLRQDLAITGSVDQRGQIQAIGGVNEKIEGFFAVCEAKGLSGQQGILIPAANRRNLMLRENVLAAVSAGLFHIWPVRIVDEGIALMTGCEPGQAGKDGAYPEGTFNRAVADRLTEFAHMVGPELKREIQAAGQNQADED